MGKKLSEMSLEELWELFPIVLKEHNSSYKDWFQLEKNEIEYILGRDIERLTHIGSTAVEGLISKPTVDILLEIDRNCSASAIQDKLKDAGWILMSFKEEPYLQMSFNKGYTPEGFAKKVFHLHVRFFGDWDELYFKDYLLLHPEVISEYGKLKQALKEQYTHDRDGYTEAKAEFITTYTKLARKEFGNRYATI